MKKQGSLRNWIGLAALVSVTGCGGGGAAGAGGTLFIEACVLGCSSGSGGSQVSCGVVNTFENQEIALLFSQSVDFSSVSKSSFRVIDTNTGSTPVGNFVMDPSNPRRLVFRPSLSFDELGNPIFGFAPGASYEIRIPGTAQGDNGPFILSKGGQRNNSRLLCTITTDQGISDPVPGPPQVTATVRTIDPVSGATINSAALAGGAVDVALDSDIVMVFDDLMNVGTLVVTDPNTGNLVAPFIRVKVDPDGNVGDPSDQIELLGSYTFTLDQLALRTTVVFSPIQPYPNAGSNALSPRKIVLELPKELRDLSGNSLGNFGNRVFTPVRVQFQKVVLPNGGENFDKSFQDNEDTARTGADWGTTTPGRLTPGLGGGSGRLGDLRLAAGETKTFITGPVPSNHRIVWSALPDSDRIFFNSDGVTSTDPTATEVQFFEGFFGNSGKWVELEAPFLSLTLAYLVNKLNVQFASDPNVNVNNYYLEGTNTINIVSKTPGVPLTPYFIEYLPGNPAAVKTNTVGFVSLMGGMDSETFAAGNLLDNFDFQANPAGTPSPIVVGDGLFEFANLIVANGASLSFRGPNPARIFVRGEALIRGVLDVSGVSPGAQLSSSPLGQPPSLALGGPFAGAGGEGADRPDNRLVPTMPNALAPGNGLSPPAPAPLSQGIANDLPSIQGQVGAGVGQVGTLGAGPGGVQWPTNLPPTRTAFFGMETNATCVCEQVGGPGGGGGYALDGSPAVPVATNPLSAQGGSNTPPPTPGGDASAIGIEPPTAPHVVRKLSPIAGNLRGGSGGGGGGSGVAGTATDGLLGACLAMTAMIPITQALPYRSHSGAAGGGGGGAVQLQAGRVVNVAGVIDASGGDGGGASLTGAVNDVDAAPGGGGSGGAILLQSRFAILGGPGRLNIAGGLGGVGKNGTAGGAGSPGLVRVETMPAANVVQVAMAVEPIDPLDPNSSNYLSVGEFLAPRSVPGSFNGAQSCWIRPQGGFFGVTYESDGAGSVGWDMDLILDLGAGPVTLPYRAPNGVMMSTFEQSWGQLLDRELMGGQVGAPLVVRFQGAKLSGALPVPPNPCSEVPLTGPLSPILPGSLTPWVRHPDELNAFSPQPDTIRFVVIFDASKLEFKKIIGVTNLRIFALPD